ncbi:hypothetical protein ACEUDH_05895 [Aeromonas dhakensis]|uniref:hypothetical protein n=1 Tax=Aeromonas dhakensis TaxID=196024 RepID=UPI0038D25253
MIREALLEMGEGYLIGNGPDPRRLLCQAGCQTRHSGRQVCGEREWSQATGEVSFPDWKVIEKKATRWSPFYLSVWRWYSPDSCPQKGVVIRLQTG